MTTKNFNDKSQPASGSLDNAYRAFATWWADQLPSDGSVTAEQYARFVKVLISEMKKMSFEYTHQDTRYIRLSSDTQELSWPLSHALRAAGLPENAAMIFPPETFGYLHEDGNLFARRERLEYSGQPSAQHINLDNFDFSDCFYVRTELRYLVVDVAPGTIVKIPCNDKGAIRYYKEEIKEGQVVVVPEGGFHGNFDALTSREVLNAEEAPLLKCFWISPKAEYTHGAPDGDSTLEKVDDQGHYRTIIKSVSRAKRLTEALVTGRGVSYAAGEPGDFVVQDVSDKGSHPSVVKLDVVNQGHSRWYLCSEDGALIGKEPAQFGPLPKLSAKDLKP